MNLTTQRFTPQSTSYSSDRDAATIIRAESELRVIEILCNVGLACLSDIARDRINDALDALAAGLNVRRQQCGLRPHRMRIAVSA